MVTHHQPVSSVVVALTILSSVVTFDSSALQQTDSITRRATRCPETGPVSISPEAVGPLPVTAPVRDLLRLCPGVTTMRETEEHAYPAAEFHISGLTILASQTIEADSLRLDEPADTWEVKGTGGVLPMGVPLTSNWAELRRTYGPAIVGPEFDDVWVMFCKFPKLYLYLNADRETVIPFDDRAVTRIPGNSRIVRIIVSLSPFGRSGCAGLEDSPH